MSTKDQLRCAVSAQLVILALPQMLLQKFVPLELTHFLEIQAAILALKEVSALLCITQRLNVPMATISPQRAKLRAWNALQDKNAPQRRQNLRIVHLAPIPLVS